MSFLKVINYTYIILYDYIATTFGTIDSWVSLLKYYNAEYWINLFGDINCFFSFLVPKLIKIILDVCMCVIGAHN